MKIITHPNPILRQKATPVVDFDENLKKLVLGMQKLLRENNGLGLAAPQVAESLQVFIINKDLGEKKDNPEFITLINPRISWKSKEKNFEFEGCLSIPGLEGKVWRSSRVRINAKDLEGKKLTIKAKDLLARAIQHEYDHLLGILYIDYIKNKKNLREVK